jgi:Zn-dependent M28 family amino/carboxypeptidase
MNKIIFSLILIVSFGACKQKVQSVESKPLTVTIPTFSTDSAYQYVKKQCSFGPRVPNSTAHQACADYLTAQLKRFGATVIEQKADLQGYDGVTLHSVNIIGSINPQAKTRVVLFSHWDSRPWADNDPNPANHKQPVMGANDGASGVGILLEMARQMGIKKPNIGVDIIFFDAEDYGSPSSNGGQNTEDTWCLGTQYWAKNPHIPGYKAKYGILLDMVGAPQATFPKEQISQGYAADIVDKVWSQAKSLGFNQYFVDQAGGAITDDHVYVNQLAGIPSIDIIHYSNTGFGSYWHTIGDTMDKVDKNTLNAVGSTLMHVVYSERP